MNIVKLIAIILLAVFLVVGSLSDIFGMHFGHVRQLLGLCAIGSGILFLISINEFKSQICHKD